MEQLPSRRYGAPPYRICLVHGGPGAPGELAPLCRELAADCGVLEPRLTAESLEGQIEALRSDLAAEAAPMVLAGHSFGAMLCLITAALFPEFVSRLVLISSGPLEESYALGIMGARLDRLDRLDPAARAEAEELMGQLAAPDVPGQEGRADKNVLMSRFGRLLARADAYDPLPDAGEPEETAAQCRYAILQKVWPEMRALRVNGKLLELAATLRMPVTAIHGDHDPHPADGVRVPLERVLPGFNFVLLPQCGHEPWRERRAKAAFLQALRREIAAS